MAFHSTDPTTGEVWRTFDEARDADVDAALARAASARTAWGRAPVAERTARLKAVGAALREKKADYAVLMAREMGKPVTQGEAEIEKCAVTCDWYAEHAERHLAP